MHLTLLACDNYDRKISTKKMRWCTSQHRESPKVSQVQSTITVNRQRLQVVASTLSRAVHIDDEVTARIAKASVAFDRLRRDVWGRIGIRLDTKLKKSTKLWYCQLSFMDVRPGLCSNAMPKPLTIST